MATTAKNKSASATGDGGARRDFLCLTAKVMGAAGAGLAMWPLIDSLNPAADVLAAATIELDLAPIGSGQRISVKWRGQPVFVSHRSGEEIAAAKADNNTAGLPDPERDAARVQREEWLIVVGICTHLGCSPSGQRRRDPRGAWKGWFCPCHGSHYDTLGRIRKGPAPKNLVIPKYQFLDNGMVRIG